MTPMLRREADKTFQRTLTRTIVLPIVLLVILALVFSALIAILLDANGWVAHTEQVLAATNNLEANIFDQESGLRGYLLTGEQSFLAPYTTASAEIGQKFDRLSDLVKDNPLQIERIGSVRSLNAQWQEFADRVLTAKQNGGDFVSPVIAGEGKLRVDAMRGLVRQIRGTEDELLLQRTTSATRVTQTVIVGSLVGLIALGGVLTFTTRRALLQLAHSYNTALQSAEQNEQNLYTQRELFRSTLASIGDAVISTDAQGRVSFMNAVAETLTGWTSDQAVGKPIDDVFTIVNEETHQPAVVPIARVLSEGIVMGLANHTALVRRDGTNMPIDDSAAPVRDASGVLVGAVLVFRDISERYRAEQELRMSERRYRDLAEAMPLSVYTADNSGKVDYYNTHWLSYTGLTMDDVREGRTQNIIHPDDIAGATEAWRAALASGTPYEFEYRRLRSDGAYRWQLGRAIPVRDNNGTIVQWIGTATDIDDYRLADQRIRSSEKRYRDLAEAMPVLVFTTTPNGIVDYYNQRWLDFTGLAMEQALTQVWPELIHPEDRTALNENWSHALATSTPLDTEFRFRRHDGAYRWQLARALPIRNEANDITHWVGTNVDIEDQKRAEQELRESEAEFRQITESMPQLVWTTMPDGYHVYFNQRWYNYTGTTLEQVRGEGWSNFLHPDDYDRTLAVWQHSLQTGEPYNIEYRFKQTGTDQYHWFLGRAAAIRDSDGQISQWFGTCTDIDEQKQTEATLLERTTRLAQTTTMLEERNRELDQFAYVTSHDLKAPLRGIANLSQWIEEDLGTSVTADIRKQLELLRGRVHRMEGLIDGILQYSRIGRTKSTVEYVDVNELVADVVDLLAPPETVTIAVEPDLPAVRTERLYLQQVFQNLISNALKHGGRQDLRIDIGCADAGGFYQFSVADNGPGIAAQYHDKVFVIFQTLASRDKVEGTGLGLSLVKKIVELHGGRVWLESSEGAGATFFFTWPKQA